MTETVSTHLMYLRRIRNRCTLPVLQIPYVAIKTNNIKLSIDELLLMFYEFFSVCLYPNEGMDYNRFYDYYNLEKANKEWIIQCNENYQFY